MKFADEFRVLKREFDRAADEFCRDYPSFVEERKRALNGMFDQADYPAASMIRDKFKIESQDVPGSGSRRLPVRRARRRHDRGHQART